MAIDYPLVNALSVAFWFDLAPTISLNTSGTADRLCFLRAQQQVEQQSQCLSLVEMATPKKLGLCLIATPLVSQTLAWYPKKRVCCSACRCHGTGPHV